MPPTPLLDHIVILVPHALLASPPPWLASGAHFRLYPGGRHADGRTENTLVLLPDGSYLELIAFVPGADRSRHRWGRAPEGSVVDWAVTLSPAGDGDGGEEPRGRGEFEDVRRRVGEARAGIGYGDLVRGGRARPDGAELKWAVAAPEAEAGAGGVRPGAVPFWCLDVTDRDLRVPYRGAARHPSGALGVASVAVRLGSAAEAESARGVYDVLFGERRGRDRWGAGALEGAVHAGAEVRLLDPEGPPGIDIALFTDDEKLDGTVVGGKVDEQHSLSIRLVAASRRGV